MLFETSVMFTKPKREVVIEEDDVNADGLNFLAGKTMDFVNRKAFEGTVLAHNDGGVPNIVLNVAESDMGMVIGKGGKIAKAIRTVVKAAAIKQDAKVSVEIVQ